jgi:hypothetical protein
MARGERFLDGPSMMRRPANTPGAWQSSSGALSFVTSDGTSWYIYVVNGDGTAAVATCRRRKFA